MREQTLRVTEDGPLTDSLLDRLEATARQVAPDSFSSMAVLRLVREVRRARGGARHSGPPCPLCNDTRLDPRIGYTSLEDMLFLEEHVPPQVLTRLAQRLRELQQQRGSARIVLTFHVRSGELQEVEPHWGETYRKPKPVDGAPKAGAR